jgi:hypothetical protein
MTIAIAELAFPIWLLVKGVNTAGWQKRAPDVVSPQPLPQG